MKSRTKELLDRAIAATIAAIEIYNKPDFLYREEAFAVLAINGWELLLKAKWLADHGNKISTLYVKEPYKKKDGSNSKKLKTKLTRSGNPFTHSLDYLAKQLVEAKAFDSTALDNISVLIEMRDSSIHFYNRSGQFPVRLQEVGAASIKNFVAACNSWFGRDLSEFNFYLMPLSFVTLPQRADAVVLNQEEKKFLDFIENLESDDDGTSPYSVTVNIDIKFTRSKTKGALGVKVTNNPSAPEVRLKEENILERYPWSYDHLTTECRKRYTDFKSTKKYHGLRKRLLQDKRFSHTRLLDPSNPKGSMKIFYNADIFQEFDKHYTKK